MEKEENDANNKSHSIDHQSVRGGKEKKEKGGENINYHKSPFLVSFYNPHFLVELNFCVRCRP